MLYQHILKTTKEQYKNNVIWKKNECYMVCTLTRVWFRSLINGDINRVFACPVSKDVFLMIKTLFNYNVFILFFN